MDGAQEVFQDAVEKVSLLSGRINENTLRYIGYGIVIFFVFMILRKIFTKYILKILVKITEKTKTNIDTKILEAFQGPIRALFVVAGVYFAILFIGGGFSYNLLKSVFLKHLLNSSVAILIIWGCYNLTTEHSLLYEELSKRFNIKLDKIVFPFLSKILRVTIIVLGVSIVLDEWGYNVSGFVAGLGIGGVAFAFAAKDALANIFGGLIIILDKPFSIGDYIKTSNVEGIVEDINFRSTKIRAIDKGLVTEPNSTLSNSTIVNWTKRDTRRIAFNIGVTYETSKEQLQNCIKEIKDMLSKDENILDDSIIVNFDKFAASSLDISIYCFTNTAEWAKYLQIKEDINFKIMDILEKEKVCIAFPSSSVYFETPLIKESRKNSLE
ncbi:MAG: mechanosensitive ion channel family protein [Clostridium sp.]|nr:mechanosensitive ion channel family protein [Clostridium sp.]